MYRRVRTEVKAKRSRAVILDRRKKAGRGRYNNAFQRTHRRAMFSLASSTAVAGYGPLNLAVIPRTRRTTIMIQEPIILTGDGGADVFRTKEEAERYAEPIDIQNGEYVAAYDANGQLLRLESHPSGYRGMITLSDPPENRSEELAQVLRIMLGSIAAARNVPFDPSRLHEQPLEQLVDFSKNYYTR